MNGHLHYVKVCNVHWLMNYYTMFEYVMYFNEMTFTLSQIMWCTFMNELLHYVKVCIIPWWEYLYNK